MISWDLYKGSELERSKKAYIGFCELLERENYKLEGEYVNNSTKVELECNKGHRYFVRPNSFKRGIRCSICAGCSKEHAKLDFINQVEKIGYKVLGKYVNNGTKVELECNKGHRYFVRPNSFKRGIRCSICSGYSKEHAKLDFINQVESENYKLIGNYVNATTKVEVECDKGHRYFVAPSNFKRGKRCPICYSNHTELAKLDFINQVEKIGYKVIGEYKNALTKIELECDKGHRYFVKPNDFKSGQRCPHCNTTSHGERLTGKILEECKLGFEQQKKFEGLIGLGGGQLSYDFFVEGYLLIEIQGRQHYESVDLYGGEEKFKIQQEHDRLKREFAINNGYKLLEIPYFSTRDLDNLENTLREELNNLLVLEEVS